MTAPGPQPAPVSPDLECTACQHVSSPHGVPATGAAPGQASPLQSAVSALQRLADKTPMGNWDEPEPAEAALRRDYAQAALDEVAAQDARPAPGDASAIVDGAVKEWLDRRTATALATAPGIDDREQGKRQGIEQLRYLHLDDYWYVLTPAILAALGKEPKPAPELAAKPGQRVDWARVSEAVADRERERDEARAELAKLREQLAGLATEMHAEAQRIAPASSQPDELPDITDQVRAQVLHEYAARIRLALGPEAS